MVSMSPAMSFYVTLLVVLIMFTSELRKNYLKSSAHHDYLLLVHQIDQLSEINVVLPRLT